MKTDQELEQLVRGTLAGRAQTVTRGPAWTGGPTGLPPEHHNPQRRWLAALTAAAAVAAVVVSVTVVRDRDTNGKPATSPTPTPISSTAPNTPTPSTSSTPAPSISTTPKLVSPPATTCATALPQAWRSALQNSVVNSGSPTPATATTQLLGTSGSDLIALRDDGPMPGSGREVVLLRPGHAPESLYSVPDPDTYNATSAAISGNWLVVGIWLQARLPKNTVGGNTPDAIEAIIAVDLTTRHSHVIVASPDYLKTPNGTGLAIVNDDVLDGKVYWNERPSYAASTGTVKSYDLSSGSISTVATNDNGSAEVVAETQGLVIDPQGANTLLVAATLPATVQAATSVFGRSHLASDGVSYAWAVDPTTIGFWRPGMAVPTYATVPGGFNTDDGGGTPSVAGDYVIPRGTSQLINMINKARATIPDSDFPNGHGEFYYGVDGSFAGYAASGIASHYVNSYWLDSPYDAIRLDTTSLPKLAC